MKKGLMLFLLVISVSLILAGCNTGEKNTDNRSWTNTLGKAQKVKIISPDGSDVITSISDDKDIENFIDAVKVDEWNSADIPSGATKGKMYKMYQEDTVKLGESNKQTGNLNEIVTMTTYKNVPYIKFSFKSYSFNFKVPEDVSEYLNNKK